jgi:ABC transporter DrrB family efflux protein
MITPDYSRRATSDTIALMHRNALRYQRRPEVIVILLIQPLVVLLLFRYVLGGMVHIPGTYYVDYLMPGVVALAIINGSSTLGIGLAEDLTSGAVDRLRALPIARSAFLVARAFTDISRNLLIVPLVGGLGLAVGFHLDTTAFNILLAYGLLLALGFAFAWISILIALWVVSAEATQGLAILVGLVASFVSSGFAPAATMPSWLADFVKVSPVTHVDNAVRILTTSAAGPVTHEVLLALVWIAAIVMVSVPLAVTRYVHHTR